MKKISLLIICILLAFSTPALAQDRNQGTLQINPMLDKGTKEVGLTGNVDFEGQNGGVDVNLNGTYGWFISPLTEVGFFASWAKMKGKNDEGIKGDVSNYGLGVFGEYNLLRTNAVSFKSVVPYIGADLGLSWTNTDLPGQEDQNALVFVPKVGLKWFFRDYVAVDANFFVAMATDDIYLNDNSLESTDVGMKFGLRVYFD